YHQWPNPGGFSVIAIPRGHVTGQISVYPDQTRFHHLVGEFGRSRAEIDSITLRMQHDDHIPDVWLDHAHGENVHLEDIGSVGGIAIAGEGTFTATGGGTFQDPIITGEGHLRNFWYNHLPLGDYDTRFAAPWVFRNLRIDFPAVE